MIRAARPDDALVGYLLGFDHLAFYANGRASYVEEVAVREGSQGSGIGRGLMDEFEVWARRRGSTVITVATRRAASFYGALGYRKLTSS